MLPDISADKLFDAVELVEVNSFVGYRVSDYMQEVLIYGGIGINVLGALFLMAYAMKYAYAFHKSKNEPIRTEAMKPKLAKKKSDWIWLNDSRFCHRYSWLRYLMENVINWLVSSELHLSVELASQIFAEWFVE